MIRKRGFVLLLTVEGLLCAGFCLLYQQWSAWLGEAIVFPVEPIARLLRTLSLSGKAGNGFALVLYVMFCLTPAAAVLLLWWKNRRIFPEDTLFLLLTPVLFVVLYLLINPGMMRNIPGGTMVLGGAVHSLWISGLLLRLIRSIRSAEDHRLFGYLRILLGLMAMLFVWGAFGQGLAGLLDSAEALRSGNTAGMAILWPSYLILILNWLADVLPYLLDIAVVFSALRLLDHYRSDRYSRMTVEAAEQLAQISRWALTVGLLTRTGINLLQLFVLRHLRIASVSVIIPIFSMVFVLCALLFARMCGESRQIKDENDSFI